MRTPKSCADTSTFEQFWQIASTTLSPINLSNSFSVIVFMSPFPPFLSGIGTLQEYKQCNLSYRCYYRFVRIYILPFSVSLSRPVRYRLCYCFTILFYACPYTLNKCGRI